MAEFEAHNLACPGMFWVLEGVAGTSNMGAISAQIAKRQGEAGAIVSGGIRDIAHSRRVNFPLGQRVTPITGKWRLETVAINADVEIFGYRVSPGDIVIADDTGYAPSPGRERPKFSNGRRRSRPQRRNACRSIEAGIAIADLPSDTGKAAKAGKLAHVSKGVRRR